MSPYIYKAGSSNMKKGVENENSQHTITVWMGMKLYEQFINTYRYCS